SLLAKKNSNLAKFLKKFIKNNPKIFTLLESEHDFKIPLNYRNTNSIESIFGRNRAFFDKYRTIRSSEFQESVFEILRLHHNFSRPYTGPRNDKSPLERLGTRLKYNDHLDLLFDCEIA
ncbi:MAG: hypothetical protein ACTSRZ_15595, partial [Promethearchaeota archaeon]